MGFVFKEATFTQQVVFDSTCGPFLFFFLLPAHETRRQQTDFTQENKKSVRQFLDEYLFIKDPAQGYFLYRFLRDLIS